ncbi:hypothetical protein LguiA_006931 [Lonicera macranthoides]
MAATSRGLSMPFGLRPSRRVDASPLYSHGLHFWKRRSRRRRSDCSCSTSDSNRKSVEKNKAEDWRFDPKRTCTRVRIQATPAALPFLSSEYRSVTKQEKFFPRCTPRNSGLQSRDTPPKRDTGIANEKDWGINMLHENVNESGINEDGSTWYRESAEDLGENGYRCRWTRMGGQSHDGSSEWKETVDAFNWICSSP